MGPIPEIAQKLVDETPAVLVDISKCSFCGMCVKTCINNVYKIIDEKNEEVDLSEFPKLSQMWKWDQNNCKFDQNNSICKLCEKIREPLNIIKGIHFAKDLKKVIDKCPTKSMNFKSPFKGKVILLKNQLHKCDPNGCKACVNICPTNSFFIPQSAEEIEKFGKIACNEETCMYCGACENSCPEKLIIVKREYIDLQVPEKSINKPWITRWLNQYNKLLLSREELNKINKNEASKKLSLFEESELNYNYNENISPIIEFDPNKLKKELENNKKVLEVINDNFNKAYFRYFIQRKNISKLKNHLKKSLENIKN